MREFMNLLEGAAKLLYHGTSVYAASAILETGIIEAGDHDDGPPGVSLTREIGVAEGFAHDVDYREIDNAFTNSGGEQFYSFNTKPRGAIFAFRSAPLKRDWRVIEHKWDGCDSEHEERVVGNGFRIEKYLVSIECSMQDILAWQEFFEAETQICLRDVGAADANTAVMLKREAGLAMGRKEMLETLKNHPKRVG